MNNQEYYKQVEATANTIVTLAAEELECDNMEINEENLQDVINDCILFEQIDSHEWIIYTRYHLQIMENTNNENYLIENIGEASGDDFHSIVAQFAFWAFYADVQDYLDGEIKEFLYDMENKE